MIDIATLIAIMGSAFAVIFSMFGMFLWVRSEANNDRRSISDIQREDRKDLLQVSRNIEVLLEGIQQEVKDFHGRLCAIEERSKKL